MIACQECAQTFVSSDATTSSLTNTPDGKDVVRQYWHESCWARHVRDVAERAHRDLQSVQGDPRG